MGDVEFERRVEEEAGSAHRRFLGDLRQWAQLSDESREDWRTVVRPLVERLAAAEGERDGLRVSLAAAENERGREAHRANEAEARVAGLESAGHGALRRVLYAGPEESTLMAAERVVNGAAAARTELDREATARRAADERITKLEAALDEEARRAARIADLEARVIALDTEVRAARDEACRAWARVVAAEDERDRQIEHGAKLADQLEGLTGERDEALSLVRRYRVQLAEVVGREAALRSALADARAGLRALARDLLGVEVDGRRVEEVGS